MPMKKKYTKKGPKANTTRKIARIEAKKVISREIETKHIDGVLAVTNFDYTGVQYNMTTDPNGGTSMSQGVSENQYIGATIRPTHIDCRYTFGVGDATNIVRMIVVQVRANDSPTMANILQSVGNVRAPLSSYDQAYEGRWRVLLDRTYDLNGVAKPFITGRFRIKGSALNQIHFSDGSGTLERGCVWIGFISDSALSTHPSVQAYWRLFFKDA